MRAESVSKESLLAVVTVVGCAIGLRETEPILGELTAPISIIMLTSLIVFYTYRIGRLITTDSETWSG